MDRTIDDLKEELDSLKQLVAEQSVLLNKLITIIHLSNTDLKDHLYLLDP